jgi:hypothetical protein
LLIGGFQKITYSVKSIFGAFIWISKCTQYVDKIVYMFLILWNTVRTFKKKLKIMSKFNETVDFLKAEKKKLDISFNEDLFVKVTKRLWPVFL